jgi:catechol 2,3-dioxygenase-like lactoylglutathione lyase family enzyme
MLGNIVELTVVVRDLAAAVERFTGLFGLKVHHRAESREFGFKNAILPTGIGHIEQLRKRESYA